MRRDYVFLTPVGGSERRISLTKKLSMGKIVFDQLHRHVKLDTSGHKYKLGVKMYFFFPTRNAEYR